jgi:hypothetical protein
MNDPILTWLEATKKFGDEIPLHMLIKIREKQVGSSLRDLASQTTMVEEMSQLELVPHNAPIEDQEEDTE